MMLLFDKDNIEVFKLVKKKEELLQRYCEESEKWLTSVDIDLKKLKKTEQIILFMNNLLYKDYKFVDNKN